MSGAAVFTLAMATALLSGCPAARGARAPTPQARRDEARETTCTVAYITDGDTIECEEGAERVRLLMIDAPELPQEDYGERATAALEAMLAVGIVARLELDVEERDRYGRLLAYVYAPDGTMVNEALVREGYALTLVYPPNVRHEGRIREAEADAREARRGLWATWAFACPPRDYRHGECE